MTQSKTKCIFDALLRAKAGFLMMRQKGANLLHYYMEKQISREAPKLLNLMYNYMEKQVFS